MEHRDNLHLIDDLMPEEVREKMRTRGKERMSPQMTREELAFAKKCLELAFSRRPALWYELRDLPSITELVLHAITSACRITAEGERMSCAILAEAVFEEERLFEGVRDGGTVIAKAIRARGQKEE